MKVLFQGDSVTDAGRTQCGNGDNLGHGYPLFVAGELSLRHPGMGFSVVNRGISGNRVVDLYQRWKCDCLNLKPDVISILIGVNDTWHEKYGNGVEVARAKVILDMLVSWTREAAPDAKLALCEPFILMAGQAEGDFRPGENWAPSEDWRAEIDERRAYTRDIAGKYGATFVPFQGALDAALERAPANYWLGDGVHPTTAGHALLAKCWLETMAPALGI